MTKIKRKTSLTTLPDKPVAIIQITSSKSDVREGQNDENKKDTQCKRNRYFE
jgi:hypothetical protein